MTLEYKADFETIPWQSPLPGMRFRIHEQDRSRLRVVEYSSDFVEPDWCRNGHVGYVLEGEFEIDFNGKPVRFGAGEGIFIPPGEEHKHMPRIISKTVRILMFEYVA
jgi:quercetin dioxygenase-like cupin family protein